MHWITLCLALAAQQEEAEKVYAGVSPSVVALQNPEGGGTGILLDDKGLILTNAHVLTSPLPFQCTVEVKGKTFTFKKVELVGVHPTHDLALAKIDPKEHGVALKPVKLSKEKPSPGRRVYAIGNPAADEKVLTKTITEGMLSAVDRELDGLKYHQFSAQVNPGNSGGPLCDKKGEVLGLVTFKITDLEGVGFAIPLHDYKKDAFVPLAKRAVDVKKSREWIDLAEKYGDKAGEMGDKYGLDDERRHYYNYLSLLCFRQALLLNPSSSSLYYNVGMLWRTLDENRIAIAYLVRAIRLQPWWDQDGDYTYRELGFSLVKLDRKAEAKIAWAEGVAKFPRSCGKTLEDFAIFRMVDEPDPLEAAYAAFWGLKVGNCRDDVMKKIYADAKGQLKSAKELDQREKSFESDLKDRQSKADDARKAKKESMTKEFSDLLKKLEAEP